MAESKYITLEQRAAWLIEKGILAWQEIQRFAMSEDEPFDSVVLLGQELWLPHHETDGKRFAVTLRIALHYPDAHPERSKEQVRAYFQELESNLSDDRGSIRIAGEERGNGA